MQINLKANNEMEEILLNYLQENASETLASKINNGTHINKDGQLLLNKKDLTTFMQYATQEARKLAAQGSQGACVKEDVVFGWLIHYFEEESIEGKLFNLDGSEYKPIVKKTTAKPITVQPKKEEPKDKQLSLFDALLEEKEELKEPIKEVTGKAKDKTPPSGTKQADAQDTPTSKVMGQRQVQQVTTSNGCSQQELFWYKYELIQKQYPNSILFYRLGDFYEALDKSAEIASEVLNLTLTGRNCGTVDRKPMCGIPYHAIDVYVDKLRNKYDVVLMHSDKEIQEYPKKDFADIVQENAEKMDALAEELETYEQDKDIYAEIDALPIAKIDELAQIPDDVDSDGEVHNEQYKMLEALKQLLGVNIIVR